MTAETVNVRELIATRPVGRYQIGIAALCGFVALLDGLDLQIIGLAGPAIIQMFKIEPARMGAVFSAALAGLTVGGLCLGPLSDRFGRRRLLMICTLWFGVFTLATPLADSFAALLVIRFLTGIGLGGAVPSLIALASEYTPPQRRAATVSVLWAGFPLGGVLGGLLGSWLIPTLGWQWLFWIGGVVPLLVVVLQFFVLPESIGYLVYSGAPSDRIAALLKRTIGADVSPNATFILGEERTAGNRIGELFMQGRAVGTILLWISFFVVYLQLVTNSAWTPILLSRVGVPVPSSALALAAYNFGSVIGTSAAGWLVSRYSPMIVLPAALVGTVLAYGSIGYAAPDVTMIIILESLVGLFLGCTSSGLIALSAMFYPTPIRSTGVGWALSMGRFGSFVGPLIVGALLAGGWTIPAIFAAIAAPAVIAAMTTGAIPHRK